MNYEESDDSWESGELDRIIKKEKSRGKYLINLLLVLRYIKDLNKDGITLDSSLNPFEKESIILNTFSDKIKQFNSFNINSMPCRMYFVIGKDKIDYFLEYKIINFKVHPKKYDGFVFSYDWDQNIVDQSNVFSKKAPSYKFLLKILNEVFSVHESGLFKGLDEIRLKQIPKSIHRLKNHPTLTAEILLKKDEFIHPKRPILGFISGKPIFNKTLIQKLYTKDKWYYKFGKKIKNDKPYRITDVKLYAEFQTENIEIEKVDDKAMIKHWELPGYHDNFTPLDCKKYKFESESNKFAFLYEDGKEIKFAHCGNDSIFIYKDDYDEIKKLIEDYQYKEEIASKNIEFEEFISKLKKDIKEVDKYLTIFKRISK